MPRKNNQTRERVRKLYLSPANYTLREIANQCNTTLYWVETWISDIKR